MDNTAVIEYRLRLLEQLSKSTEAFCAACRAVKDPRKAVEEHNHLPGRGHSVLPAWSVHQLAQHVRDVDAQCYGMRVRRTLAEDYPTFLKFDADAWSVRHYDADEPLEKTLAELSGNIHNMVEQLRDLRPGAWSRLGHHEIQGKRTMQLWVERSLEHIREHLETVETVNQ